MSPLIGITASYDFKNKKASLGKGYFRAVEQAGGIPVAIPPLEDENTLLALAGRLDGILFSGGPDVDPSYFGEEPHPHLGMVCPQRDRMEIFLAREMIKRGKPVLGICRGIQLINIAMGGSIIQDIPAEIKRPIKHQQDAPQWYATHRVEIIDRESLLYKIMGQSCIRVNSFHHQSVKALAPGFKITARASDGVIEAIEAEDRGIFCLGVQWHPEEMWERDPLQFRLFKCFNEAAKN